MSANRILCSKNVFNNFGKQVKHSGNLRTAVRKYHDVKGSILTYGREVAKAKESNLPIVALESTIITHGMPYPDNLETALEVENIIRQKGAVPATIAVLDGKIKVGVDEREIEKLAKNEMKNTIKVSRRDFSYVTSQGLNGGTTVSGTMLVANKAGIEIMATGGIGGVHRQVELSMDVSADLKELGRTPVAVVCSGVKAILDIPKTLEYLESEGVPVGTIGPTDKFPAFYSRETYEGLESPMRLENTKAAASLILAQTRLELKTGILLAVPIPDSFSLDPREIEEAIKTALRAAELQNVHGKAVTPFLLGELSKLTTGRSLRSNKALIKNNAEVAAEIALHLTKLRSNVSTANGTSSNTKRNPVVIGGSTFDTVLRVKEPEIKFNGGTHEGESRWSCGGVGRNLTAALMNLGMVDTKLLTVIGDDQVGKAILQSIGDAASTVSILPDLSTAKYAAIIDNKGNCCFGIGEMEAFTNINSQLINRNIDIIKNTPLIVMDGNPTLDAMKVILDTSRQHRIPLWYEPTDLQKVLQVFNCAADWKGVLKFTSPNISELMILAKYFKIPVPSEKLTDLNTIKQIAEQLVEWIPVVVTTLGAQGVLISRKASKSEPFLNEKNELIETGNVQSHLYHPLSYKGEISSVSGCGDCLAAGIITGILRGWEETTCVSLGLHAAKESLTSFETVPNSLQYLPKTQDYYKTNF